MNAPKPVDNDKELNGSCYRATPRSKDPTGKQFVRKPTPKDGRHFESPPARPSERYGTTATLSRSSIRHLG